METPLVTDEGLVKPLRGIRVLELARTLAGPLAGQILADLGADVVKVERPRVGDETRRWGPPFIADDTGTEVSSEYFQSCNRGKRSIEADFEVESHRERVRKLSRRADVVIENFRVGTLAKFGLDAATLRKDNPGLIWCSITGFGQAGPYANRAGYDFAIQALSGILDLNSPPGVGYHRVPIPVSDIGTGLYAVIAILAQLKARDQSGVGAVLDLSLFDTQIAMMSQVLTATVLSSTYDGALAQPSAVPQFVVQTRNGAVGVVVATQDQFLKLLNAIGCPEVADMPDFASDPLRRLHVDALAARLSSATSHMDAGTLVQSLAASGVPAGKVNRLSEVPEDPQFRARELLVQAGSAASESLKLKSIRFPALFDNVSLIAQAPAPLVGQHTDEVLSDRNWM